MTNKIYNHSDLEKISNFLTDQDSSIFQSVQMIDVLADLDKYESLSVIETDINGDIQGFLLAIIQKEHAGRLGFFSSRSIIIGGPIVKNGDLNITEQILKTYNAKIKGKAIYSQFRNLNLISQDRKEVFEKLGYAYEDHLDILHDLTISIDDQWANLHKGRRKNIRRAERSGVSFHEVSNTLGYEKSLELIKGTYERVKLPMPSKQYFDRFKESLLERGILKIFVAKYDDNIIATRMVLCYNDLIYDWYAGADSNHLDKYPNDFLPWKTMEWGSLNGYKKFDFGGAGKPNVAYGVRDHKLKFGGELVNFGRFQKNHYPLLFKGIEFGFKLYRKYFV